MAEPLTTDVVPTITIEGYRMTEPLTAFSLLAKLPTKSS